jgi:hypothetical protein
MSLSAIIRICSGSSSLRVCPSKVVHTNVAAAALFSEDRGVYVKRCSKSTVYCYPSDKCCTFIIMLLMCNYEAKQYIL